MNKDYNKKKYPLLQSDSTEEDELETDLVSIQIDPDHSIKINFSQLCKHSKLIRNNYLISDVRTKLLKDIQKFQQENKIDSNNIISFLQLLKDEDIEMTNDKYFDFYKLSKFFQINKLTKNLDKYYRENVNNLDFIIAYILNEDDSKNAQFNFIPQMENVLIDHICEFLKNEKTKKMKVSSIYRILEKCNKSQIPNGELFDLIIISIPTFFVLFEFIDLRKLSNDQFGELFKFYTEDENKKYFRYLSCNLVFINELKKMKID